MSDINLNTIEFIYSALAKNGVQILSLKANTHRDSNYASIKSLVEKGLEPIKTRTLKKSRIFAIEIL